MNEHEFRTLLTKATEDRPPGINLMPATPKRRLGGVLTPKRRLARVLVPIASLGVAALVGAIAVVLPASQSSAQAQVLAAAENTSQESYRIHTTSGAKVFDGAIDPVQRVAVITRAGDGAETRFIGDQMFDKESRDAKWMVSPRSDVQLASAPPVVALVKLAPLDPQAALQRLRSATDVREHGSASGQGWTGRRFTFSLEDANGTEAKGIPGKSLRATGAVDVDDQGRVRRLEVTFGDTGQRLVMEISDFGTPVSVTAPPADQVEQLPAEKPGKPTKPTKPTDEPTVKTS
ncbi:hypothetical protein ACFLIM_04830 [Nonomuraea sp. M3C6]|uniref:Outer membrane lipoprotein-sorting protein n=1 Tax=Nonomuraea marmarensis TaxID=3351344 RepID=A0ABW7A588_9ACTN